MKSALPDLGVEARASRPSRALRYGYPGIARALRTTTPTCLERALVLQAWLALFGDPPDVIVAVRKRGDAPVEAHAWVDGEDETAESWHDATYEEISRLPFRAGPPTLIS